MKLMKIKRYVIVHKLNTNNYVVRENNVSNGILSFCELKVFHKKKDAMNYIKELKELKT